MVTTISATIAVLCERFPRCFVQYERRRKPLKIGIHTDLLQALEGAVAPLELGRALQAYVSNPFYLRACVNGAWRYDLAGAHVGEVDEGQAKSAAEKLAGIEKKQALRKEGKAKQAAAAVKALGQKRRRRHAMPTIRASRTPRRSNGNHRMWL